MAKNFDCPVYMLRWDIASAFDKVSVTSMMVMLQVAEVPAHLRLLLIREFLGVILDIRYGGTSTKVPQNSGVKQGSLEGPRLFNAIVHWIFRPMVAKWHDEGFGFCVSELLSVCLLAFADDVIFVAKDFDQLQLMLASHTIQIHNAPVCQLVP